MPINHPIKTVLFDMDGTLLDTLDDLTNSVNYAIGQQGFPPRTSAEIRQFVGNGIARLVHLALPADTDQEIEDQCLATFRVYYQQHMRDKTAPYEGILELLDGLKELQMAVVSNKFDPAIQELCPLYFGQRIPLAFGERPGYEKKPSPDLVYLALEQLGADPKTAVYIGDTEVDMATGKNAGLSCIGVTWGFREKEVLEQAGADVIVDTPKALLAYLLGEGTEI